MQYALLWDAYKPAGTAESYVGGIRIIPLETKDGCVVDQRASIVSVSEKGIIVRSGKGLLLFSLEGKFLHTIGREGHGHGEHGRIISACADAEGGQVYILSFGSELTAYSLEGECLWKRTLNVPRDYTAFSLFRGTEAGLLCEMRRYRNDGLDVCVSQVDSLGTLAKDILVYTDYAEIDVTRSSFSISYSNGEAAKLKLDFDNQLYTFGRDSITSVTLDLGDFAPDRKDLEDMRQQKNLYSNRCQILDIEENGRFFFLIASLQMKYRLVIVEKKGKREIVADMACENPKVGGGMPLSGFVSLHFWPSWSDGNITASLVSPSMLAEEDLARIFGAGLAQAADGNPLVLIAKECH